MIRVERLSSAAMLAHCERCLANELADGPTVLLWVITHRCRPADLRALGKSTDAELTELVESPVATGTGGYRA